MSNIYGVKSPTINVQNHKFTVATAVPFSFEISATYGKKIYPVPNSKKRMNDAVAARAIVF